MLTIKVTMLFLVFKASDFPTTTEKPKHEISYIDSEAYHNKGETLHVFKHSGVHFIKVKTP